MSGAEGLAGSGCTGSGVVDLVVSWWSSMSSCRQEQRRRGRNQQQRPAVGGWERVICRREAISVVVVASSSWTSGAGAEVRSGPEAAAWPGLMEQGVATLFLELWYVPPAAL